MYGVVVLVILGVSAVSNGQYLQAIVHLRGELANGDVTFTQQVLDGEVLIEGTVTGLPAGLHGFRVLEDDSEIGDGCGSTPGHFNPFDNDHGRLDDFERQAGDLGNIEFGEDQVATISIRDSLISLSGERSIVARAVVVTSGPDFSTEDNSRNPVSCGIVELL